MKYELRGSEKRENVLRFFLIETNGIITLCAKDEEGFDWSLLRIENGQIHTIKRVSEKLGFEVDKNGEIEIYDDEREQE